MSRRYKPDSFDFAAIHVIPLDAWFIIPGMMIKLGILLTPGKSDSKYYEYEEAWHLLKPSEKQFSAVGRLGGMFPGWR
jgi:hypothetical protein